MCCDKMIFPFFGCFEFQSTSINQALILKSNMNRTQSAKLNDICLFKESVYGEEEKCTNIFFTDVISCPFKSVSSQLNSIDSNVTCC